jgi:purine-binding chemotaxis protein CheW
MSGIQTNGATLADAVATIDERLDRALVASEATTNGAAARVVAGERYVLLSIASALYAVLETFVTEIDRVPGVTPVPHVPEWVRGVTSVRGDILSVIDMRSFLGLEPRQPRTARLLVVRLPAEEFATGLIVDSVERIVEIASEAIGEPESPLEGPLAPYLNGTSVIEARATAVLDLDRLLRSPHIRQFEERKADPADVAGQGTPSCEER